MAVNVYIARTPLILEDANGVPFRVEVGEAVELTHEQYAQVAAHVMLGVIHDDDLAASGELPPENQPKPQRGRKAK